jgi:hypothetical protein
MTDAEFDAFLSAANEELRQKQEALKHAYGLGSYRRFWWEQATAKIQFFDAADALKVEADVIHIGTYAEKSSTWRWAWGSQSLLPWLRTKTEKLKELEAITGFEIFGKSEPFRVEGETHAWELAAISVKHLGAIGCYRAPSSRDGPTTFFAISSAWRV